MNRRNVLILGPAACTTAFITRAANAEPKTDTPVIRMFREWEELEKTECAMWDAWDGPACDMPKEIEEFSAQNRAFERKILDTPSQDARDILAKFIAVTSYGLGYPEYFMNQRDFWKQAREFVG